MDTFIVRLWRNELTGSDAPAPGVRGVVTHLASGDEQVFRTPGELLAFFDAVGIAPAGHSEPATDGRGPDPRG